MLHLFRLLALLFAMLIAAPAGDDDTDDDVGDDDDDEGDDTDQEDDEDDEDDDDQDDDDLDDAGRADLEKKLRKANRQASRYRRALKAGKKVKEPRQGDDHREARIAVKEALVDAGLPSKAAALVDLAGVELDDLGELTDPEDVIDQVEELLEELGAGRRSSRDDDDDEPRGQRRRKSKRPVPKDRAKKGAKGSGKSTTERLIEQAGLS